MPWYLGRPGTIVQLPPPARATQTPYERLGATHQLLSGGRVRDSFGVKRSWQFNWQALSPDAMWLLEAFVTGQAGAGPYVLFDPEQRNLLAPNVASAGSVTSDTTGFNYGPNVTMSTLGSLLTNPPKRIFLSEPTSVVAVQSVIGTSGYLPVVGGLTYTLSMWYASSARSHYAEIVWFDSSKSAISSVDGTATASTGWLTVTGAAPSNAAYVICNVNVTTNSGSTQGASIEQIQLEQSASRSPWVPGWGAPYVVIDGGGRGRQQTNQNDYSLTLLEV